MTLALVVIVGFVGVVATIFAAARMWKANRSGQPREVVYGYFALMMLVSVISFLLLRAL